MKQFRANQAGTFAFTANGSSQNAALPGGGGLFFRLENAGPQIVFCELTANANLAAQVPTANVGGGFPVFANQPALYSMAKAGDTNLAFISAGNSTLYVTRGDSI